ncbi:MAG: hypothetical protein J6T43_04545 [Prevotella sp.]|nr:hypothetical protein [Prevotella sp.]
MKRLFTLIALVCLVGVNLLAQETVTIDFRDFSVSYYGDSQLEIDENGYLVSLSEEGKETRYFPEGSISVEDPNAWQIGHDQGHNNASYLQRKANVGDQSVFIHNLNLGDKVYLYVTNDNCYNVSRITDLAPNRVLTYGNFVTVNVPGTMEISMRADYAGIDYIRIEKAAQSSNNNVAEYTYDPGIESYDLYWVNRYVNNSDIDYTDLYASFPLDYNDLDAIIITNLTDGTPLNKRIAISEAKDGDNTLRPWTFTWRNELQNQNGNESQGLLNRWSWHNFSICDLKAGDRVVLTLYNRDYNGEGNVGHAKIGSKQNGGNVDGTIEYRGCAGFMDLNDNGVQDEGEPTISAGMNLEGNETQYHDLITYPITVTEDGHLDFAFDENVLLKKVEIYSDHKASMVHKYNGSLEAGYTSYFNITGQLETKQHVIPGGLQVHVGNDDEDQHATVVASAYTPVVSIYDENHYKIARNDNSTGLFSGDLTTNLPTNGTYYKFVPEISGSMDIKFYTSSINYLWYGADGLYRDGSNTSNEYASNASCPYYLIDVDENGITSIKKQFFYNGNQLIDNDNWSNINVVAGHTYYLFGGWQNGATASNYTDWVPNENKKSRYFAGVPKLLEVTYRAEKLVYPLAKWVPERTGADDDLATVKGYSNVKVKKMSDNIQSCEPYLQDGKLKIKNIVLKDNSIGGGVILIEVTDNPNSYNRADPVFALTVAYDASYNSASNIPEAQRGHTWDFSTKQLNGLQWKNTYSTYAVVTPFGTSDDPNSLLNDEMNWTDSHGIQNSDWTFNYRLRTQDNNYDPQFVNNYDMVGDNADMVWDSEGMVILANFTKNSIYNEFTNSNNNEVQHTEETDPDRYVGIWPNAGDGLESEFLIPWLNKDDRVIIYMGSGTGPESETKEMVFNITNALDAEHNEISATDNYVAGGSHWDGATGDPYYRGCYHFFAKEDGDMRFKLVGGTMCKIYKIQIYHGDRINTNEIKGATATDKFLLWSRDNDPNDNTGKDIGPTYNWTLNYFGKDQKIADGSNGVKNGIVELQATKIKSGANINDNGFTTSNVTDPTQPLYNTFTYQHDYGQIGTFRMRGKDMEKNMKYVADYGDHNVTVAYQETQTYPYTWDFMDMIGYSVSHFSNEDAIGIGSSITTNKPTWFISDDDWNLSYEKSSTDLSLWEKLSGNNPAYDLRLNSQKEQGDGDLKEKDNIFETAKDIPLGGGNQVWANGAVVPETQGLWFYSYNNNQNNGKWGINSDGMDFGGTSKDVLKVVVPNVPANAAVYLRMVKNREVGPDYAYEFKGGNTNLETYGPIQVDGTNEYILAIMNKGTAKRHLTLSIAGYRLKKLAVSTDPKKIGSTGYATESRAEGVGIDHNLTAYLTGKDIKAYTGAINADNTQLVMTQFGATETSAKILPAATDGDSNGCILHHSDGAVSILNGGFHVFVPDMHDKINSDRMVNTTTNVMKSFLPGTTDASTKGFLGATAGDNTNLVLTAKKYSYGTNGSTVQSGTEVNFVRVDPNGNNNQGASLSYCSAYLQLPTSVMVPLTGSSNGGNAKLSIVFVDELFGEVSQGIATGIVDLSPATGNNPAAMEAEWYNLSGQKLNGQPTEKGMYIVNGKKVLVK